MASLTSIYNRYTLVKQIPIFQKLRWFDLQKIARKAKIVEFKKSEFICRQGNPPDAFYCLISGRVLAYNLNPDQRKANVEFIRRGMYFGVISLLTGENHSMNYEAINDSLVLKIAQEDFQSILTKIPQLGLELSQTLSKRIRSRTIPPKNVYESSIISIYSPVKGTGSSTYVVNLALSLQRETQRKVILVNIVPIKKETALNPSLDNVGEATPQWKKTPVHLKDIIDDYDKITHSIFKGELKVDLLNVCFNPEDTTLVNQISRFVSALVNDYYYVVVDLPNDMDEVVLKTLTQSDVIQLICLDNKEQLKMIREVIYQLEEELKENFNQERIRVIIRAHKETNIYAYEDLGREIDFPIYTILPHIHRSDLNVAVVSEMMSVITPHLESEYAKILTKIARQISGVSVGLVLGGGAALGIAHVGVIRVLEQEKIPIDIVAGSSMGALLASLWVTGRNADDLEKLAREFETHKSLFKLFDLVFPVSGLIGGGAIKRWLHRHLGEQTFYHTRIPLKVVAYDLFKRQEIIIDSGLLFEAVRRSIAIPGVIEPVLEKDKVIIDGGVLNPLPTNVLTRLGIKKIIAVNVLQSPEDVIKGYMAEQNRIRQENSISLKEAPWHYITFRIKKNLTRMFSPNIPDIIVRSLQATEYVISQQSAQEADIVIHPDLGGVNWFELYKVTELIKSGEEAAQKALPAIQKLLKE